MSEIFGIPTQALFGQLLIGLINGSFYALLSLGLADEFMHEQEDLPLGLAGRYFGWISRVCFNKSRSVITVSRASREEALRRFPNTRAKVIAIHNGVLKSPGIPQLRHLDE